MSKIILVNGKLTREKLKQILKRHAPKGRRDNTKTTLGDIWPEGKEKGNVEQSCDDNSP